MTFTPSPLSRVWLLLSALDAQETDCTQMIKNSSNSLFTTNREGNRARDSELPVRHTQTHSRLAS
eukprot:6479056-Amphidinium_carterae.1